MKQTITESQIDQLNEPQRALLEQWCADKGYSTMLKIGEMIEFIQDKRPIKSMGKDRFGKWFVTIDSTMHGHKAELADALWETITRILKTESGQ